MKGAKVILLAIVLIAFTIGAIPALAEGGKVWVESSSPREIKVGYSGFELFQYGHPGWLYINEPYGTRSVSLDKLDGDPGFLYGDIYSEFSCDTPKVIVYGFVLSATGDLYRLENIEVACHAVRLPFIIQP